ncbi:hippurate hydrolase [Salinihabitans flavidus]|uniref:Hippurate hydrolase n=1 Tax=Salinihabitans flavidus TaxID=569882 RepID=A0A1H8RQA0_9RHOB|nr:M20 aminoacylase family protein [Salinihabitans flavidus]SEO68631.1 hippurate hydrolase [Salinihabitans flavidus]
MAVVNRIAAYSDEMTGWRRHLHMHPELSLECHETAAFVVEKLRAFGVDEIHEGIATSGVVAVIEGNGSGPVTGLRADMDALPMQEETGAEWASTIPGRMHACGHDGHTTMLLGAAKYLAETRNFTGRAVLIFQPAEESIGGGRIMVEEGIMDRFGVEEVYALHTDSFARLGEFRTCSGPIMAAVDDFEIHLTGVGGHAAYPHECRDPVQAALGIGTALQTITARNVNPLEPLVVSLTQVHTGSATNIVPEKAYLAGTVRSFSPQVRDMVEARLHEIVAGLAPGYGVTARVDYNRSYPPTVNHAAQTETAAGIAREIVGEEQVVADLAPEMGAEDFSYMLEARPGAFLFLGQGIGPSPHHPEFDFNDAAAPIGASFFARLIETRHARA